MISGGMSGAILFVLALVLLFAMLFVSGGWFIFLAAAVIAYMTNALCLLSRSGFFGEGYIGKITAYLSRLSVGAMMSVAFSMVSTVASVIGIAVGVVFGLVFFYPGCDPITQSQHLIRKSMIRCNI